MSYKIAVVGATGNVGREMLNILDERNFPFGEVVALASENSKGKKISFGEIKILESQVLADYDFTGTDIALFSPGGAVSAIHAPRAAAAGCIVIDNTSHFRMDTDIPLVVPEVNPEAIAGYKTRNIISNPNCSTIQMLVALKPLHDAAKIKRVVVSTYQAVSGAGKEGMDELFDQTKSIYMNDMKAPKKFPRQISFNVIPMIGKFLDNGYTDEEMKMVNETKKILDKNVDVTVTCVRVPVFNGHSESINVEFESPLSPEEAREILREAPGISVIDEPRQGRYITPAEASTEHDVYVSRIRKDFTIANGLNLWVVADNLRKGAALNAVQIAEHLVKYYL